MNCKIYYLLILLLFFIPEFYVFSESEGTVVINSSLEPEFQSNIKKAKSITDGRKSLPFSFKALDIANKIGDAKDIGQALMEISFDYENIGDLKNALKYNFMALHIYEANNFKSKCGTVYNGIGIIYNRQGNVKLAVYYINKAIEVHKKLNSSKAIAEDYNNLGEIYRTSKEDKLAMENFRKAYSIFLTNKDTLRLAYAAGNMGLVFAAQNKKDSANYYISKSTEILKKRGDFYPITIYLIESATIYIQEDNLKEALKEAKEALAISEGQNLKEQIRDANKLLSQIYVKLGDYKNAHSSLQAYYDARDSISNEKVVGEMAEMRADYEVSKKETEIKGLEAVNELRTRINIWLSVGVLLITVLSVFLFRLNKNLKTANQQLSIQKVELEQKNEIIRTSLEEKETLLKEIHHRVKNNLQIISSLLSLQSHTVTNKKVLDAFQESQQRLHSISLIHQKLYQTENLARVNFKDYIEDLVGTIHHTLAANDKKIGYKIISENIELDIDTAVPLGLIVNELATNAYKYAFKHVKDGLLTISLQENGTSRYKLIIRDNGPGIPGNMNIFETESLGLRLVNILSRQLQGTLDVKSDNGAIFCLEFNDVIPSVA